MFHTLLLFTLAGLLYGLAGIYVTSTEIIESAQAEEIQRIKTHSKKFLAYFVIIVWCVLSGILLAALKVFEYIA